MLNPGSVQPLYGDKTPHQVDQSGPSGWTRVDQSPKNPSLPMRDAHLLTHPPRRYHPEQTPPPLVHFEQAPKTGTDRRAFPLIKSPGLLRHDVRRAGRHRFGTPIQDTQLLTCRPCLNPCKARTCLFRERVKENRPVIALIIQPCADPLLRWMAAPMFSSSQGLPSSLASLINECPRVVNLAEPKPDSFFVPFGILFIDNKRACLYLYRTDRYKIPANDTRGTS